MFLWDVPEKWTKKETGTLKKRQWTKRDRYGIMYPVKTERTDTNMKRKTFKKEEVEELSKHPYVERVSEWTIRFTEEFKRIAYGEYIGGKSIREIFAEAGFDEKVIGEKRIQNFRTHLISKADEENGFADKRKDKSLQAPLGTEAQMMKRIRELEHRNAYLEQENDFLKKIQELEKSCDGKAGKRK